MWGESGVESSVESNVESGVGSVEESGGRTSVPSANLISKFAVNWLITLDTAAALVSTRRS